MLDIDIKKQLCSGVWELCVPFFSVPKQSSVTQVLQYCKGGNSTGSLKGK